MNRGGGADRIRPSAKGAVFSLMGGKYQAQQATSIAGPTKISIIDGISQPSQLCPGLTMHGCRRVSALLKTSRSPRDSCSRKLLSKMYSTAQAWLKRAIKKAADQDILRLNWVLSWPPSINMARLWTYFLKDQQSYVFCGVLCELSFM